MSFEDLGEILSKAADTVERIEKTTNAGYEVAQQTDEYLTEQLNKALDPSNGVSSVGLAATAYQHLLPAVLSKLVSAFPDEAKSDRDFLGFVVTVFVEATRELELPIGFAHGPTPEEGPGVDDAVH